MDLNEVTIDDTATIDILHPNGDKTDIKITIFGGDSDQHKAQEAKNRNKNMNAARKGKKITAEQSDAQDDDLLIASVASWENVEENGKLLECNSANIKKVFKAWPFVREQINRAIVDRTNFMKS